MHLHSFKRGESLRGLELDKDDEHVYITIINTKNVFNAILKFSESGHPLKWKSLYIER